MDWGVITAAVAAVFGFLGIVVGMFISRFLSPKKEEPEEDQEVFTELRSRLEDQLEEFSSLMSALREKVDVLTSEEIDRVKSDVEEIVALLDKLKEDVSKLNVTQDSRQALEKAIEAAKNLELSVPHIDTSLLLQIKDNLLIIRNDIQTLLLSRKEEKEDRKMAVGELGNVLSSLESALKLAKELNTNIVRDELIVMANCLKSEDKNELLKAVDREALTSKELVLLLGEIKKELEGVAK